MNDALYKDILEKAKADYISSQQKLGAYARDIEILEGRISKLREMIVALSRLLGEPFVEEDAVGLTDAIRQAYRNNDGPLASTDVRRRLVSMGYDISKYGNLMASVHSVIGRLEKRGEIQQDGTIEGKPVYSWVPKTLVEKLETITEKMVDATVNASRQTSNIQTNESAKTRNEVLEQFKKLADQRQKAKRA